MWLALYGILGRYRHKSTAGATNRNISSKYHVTCNGGTPAPFTVVRLDDVECFPTASPAGEAEAALAGDQPMESKQSSQFCPCSVSSNAAVVVTRS
jgi:hypothetical protein